MFADGHAEGDDDVAADHAVHPADRRRRPRRRGRPAAARHHRRARHDGRRRARSASCRRSPSEINEIILLIGLAVGVDYALFYLRREREERAAGRSKEAALEAAAATSGRAVLVSGFTVMIAMAGMYLSDDPTFMSFATGGILVVAVAMIGSLTVLPALLSMLGDKIDQRPHPAGRTASSAARPSSACGRAIVDRVLQAARSSRRSSAAACSSRSPSPRSACRPPSRDSSRFPQDMKAVQTFNHLQEAFPSEATTVIVVIKAEDVTSPPVTAGIDELRRTAAEARGPVHRRRGASRSTRTRRSPCHRADGRRRQRRRRPRRRWTSLRDRGRPGHGRQGRRASRSSSAARPPS